MILKLFQPVLQSLQELEQYRINGVSPNADRIYELVKTITSSEDKARNAQAEVLLRQIPL